MVARPADPRYSANAGELDPSLAGRVDIKQYYSGGLRFKHVEPVPQSGFRDMGGTIDNGRVRARMDTLAQSDVTESPGPHSSGSATVFQCTVSGNVTAVHINRLASGADTHDACLEVRTGGNWIQIGPTITIGPEPQNRTFALAPNEVVASADRVRVRVQFASEDTAEAEQVEVLADSGIQDVPRYASMRHDSGDRYFIAATRRWLDIFLDDEWVAGLFLLDLLGDRLPEINFYTENATIGIFHRDLNRSIRIRRAGSAADWIVDSWPYEGVPTVDLGGNYPQIADRWTVTVRWSENRLVTVAFTVDGEQTTGIRFTDAGGTATNIADADWDKFADDVATAINDLPSIAGGVTATADLYDPGPSDGAGEIAIRFGDASGGREYQFDAQVTNTSAAAALASHTQIGERELEPLFSQNRGYPGGAALVQDRLGYFDIKAEPAALALSQAGEYFNLNIEQAGENRARLDKLRAGQTAERILAVLDATYLLVFTDQSIHFAANRTISGEQPPNYTQASSTGIVPHTEPVELEQKIFFVAFNDDTDQRDGHQVLSLTYDELMTNFQAVPESLLASHLIEGVMRTKRQKANADSDASKMWALRRDGRLISCQMIRSEEILGMCEWIAPQGGLVREIEVDARNRLRLCVERNGVLRHERQDLALFLHAVVSSTCDLSGIVRNIDIHAGREVWAIAEGYVLGPFTVSTGGNIDLGDVFQGEVLVGLWSPPLYESMPFYHVRRDDTVIERPGRIPVAHINVIGTTSLAVGANGQDPAVVPLLAVTDPLDAPMPPKTGKYTVSGMLGSKVGTTLVITQTRPGRLRVRDYKVEEAL